MIYKTMQIHTSVIITFGLLTLSIAALWIPKKYSGVLPKQIGLWIFPFVLSLASGLHARSIHVIALAPISLFFILCAIWGGKKHGHFIYIIVGTFILVFSLGMIAHAIPGFSNPKIFSNLIVSEGAIPYTLYFNFDKALVGLFILAFCHTKLFGRRNWVLMLKNVIPKAFLLIIVVMLISLSIGYVRFQNNSLTLLPLWGWANLFFTCIAEESLFRGFLQKTFVRTLEGVKYGNWIGVLLASLLFGLEHYNGGINYMILATISGIGYGWIYHSTKAIESSIFAHFFLNATHFMFFTYPTLAK